MGQMAQICLPVMQNCTVFIGKPIYFRYEDLLLFANEHEGRLQSNTEFGALGNTVLKHSLMKSKSNHSNVL